MRFGSVALSALMIVLAGEGALAGPQDVRTSGACSPAIVRSQIRGDLTIVCGANRRELEQLRADLERATARARMTTAQVDELLVIVNQVLAANEQNTASIIELSGRLAAVEARDRPEAVINDIRTLIDPNRDPTVQYLDNIRVILTGVDVSGEYVSFGFEVLNQGRTDYRLTLMGKGSRQGSQMIVGGEIIPATEIEFAGRRREGSVEAVVIPGIPLRGRVIFSGVRLRADEIDAFELGHSYRNARAQGWLRFLFD